jgi:hypothetical protein
MTDDTNTPNPLRELDRAVPPPAGLEHRVRQSLRARGRLRPRTPSWLWPGTLAAAAVLVVAAYVAGARSGGTTPVVEGRSYVLLLYEDSTFDGSRPEGELVAEYSRWAAALRDRGMLRVGEKLDAGGQILETGPDSIVVRPDDVTGGPATLSGLFIIQARTDAEAIAIAAGCPHLKYRGRIVLRPIA